MSSFLMPASHEHTLVTSNPSCAFCEDQKAMFKVEPCAVVLSADNLTRCKQ